MRAIIAYLRDLWIDLGPVLALFVALFVFGAGIAALFGLVD